jgi:two-component system LytT family response regulator
VSSEPARPLRLLIVDDEPPARARLRRLLAELPGVEVTGEAGDGVEALEAAARLKPDALLLDVQMPEISGLDVAASLPGPDGPAVIFVTAFDRYALQAFDAAAVDYLLKPVEPERLARAVARLRERQRPARPPAPRQLLVEERGRLQVLAVDTIGWLQAADNYVELHAADGRHWLLRRTLAALLADLGPGFLRIHRSHAVALAAVAEVLPADKGDARVRLAGGAELPCSRNHRAALVQALQQRA